MVAIVVGWLIEGKEGGSEEGEGEEG